MAADRHEPLTAEEEAELRADPDIFFVGRLIPRDEVVGRLLATLDAARREAPDTRLRDHEKSLVRLGLWIASDDSRKQPIDWATLGKLIAGVVNGLPAVRTALEAAAPAPEPTVIRVHYGDPDDRARAYNEGYDDALEHTVPEGNRDEGLEALRALDTEIERRRSPDYQRISKRPNAPPAERAGAAAARGMEHGELTGLVLARALVAAALATSPSAVGTPVVPTPEERPE